MPLVIWLEFAKHPIEVSLNFQRKINFKAKFASCESTNFREMFLKHDDDVDKIQRRFMRVRIDERPSELELFSNSLNIHQNNIFSSSRSRQMNSEF